MAPLRHSGGARQRASPRLRSVATPISRCAAQHTCGDRPALSRGLRAPRPRGGLRPPLLALRASTSLLWRLCLQTSAALRRRASEWWSQRHSPFTPLLLGPPLGGGCASGSRTPPNGTPFNLYRSRGGTKGTPVARPTSMGRPPRGASRGFPYPKNRFLPIGRVRTASLFGCVKALENNALRRVFL